MNRLVTTKQNRKYLLGTVSAIALLTSVALAEPAIAESDGSNPQVWIELGGGFDQMDNAQSVYAPPFMAVPQSFRDFSVADAEKPTRSAFNFNGSITFQPDNSDWVLSASILYGRSEKHGRLLHAQPAAMCSYYAVYHASFCDPVYAFANAIAQNNETHAILDFKVGKDVGLGLLGKGSSVISAGLRYAQFTSQTTAQLSSRPTNQRSNVHEFTASLKASRSFTGIGPSLSWDASAPLLGAAEKGLVSLDWGVNAALLFGRQKAAAHHETVETRYNGLRTVIYDHPASPARSKSVTVPNLGGFAGLSLRYANAKISFGYRADMFFGAVDTGIDTRKTENRSFYGPFASISIGLP